MINTYDAVHHPQCVYPAGRNPRDTQCRTPGDRPEAVTLPLIQQFTTQAINDHKNRELLDKAIVGLGAMVDLIERHRATQPNLMTTQPEAMAAESLDLVKAMEGAAEQERKRIVAHLRLLHSDPDLVMPRGALTWLANEIEAGRIGSRS